MKPNNKARRPRINQHKAESTNIPRDVDDLVKSAGLNVKGSFARGGQVHHVRFYRKKWLLAEWWSSSGRAKIGPIDANFPTLQEVTHAVLSSLQ